MEAQNFNAAAKELDQTKPQNEEKTIKDRAKSFGKGLVDFSGTALDIVGGVGMQAMAVVALWVVGAIVLDMMGLGLGIGLIVGFLGFFLLSFVGNGIKGYGWNPKNALANAAFLA